MADQPGRKLQAMIAMRISGHLTLIHGLNVDGEI